MRVPWNVIWYVFQPPIGLSARWAGGTEPYSEPVNCQSLSLDLVPASQWKSSRIWTSQLEQPDVPQHHLAAGRVAAVAVHLQADQAGRGIAGAAGRQRVVGDLLAVEPRLEMEVAADAADLHVVPLVATPLVLGGLVVQE